MAKVMGLPEFQAKMRAIPPEIRAAVRPVMQRGAEEIVALAEELVPVEQGRGAHPDRPPGTLKAAIEWHWKSVLSIAVTARPSVLRNLGIWVERGTEGSAATPARYYRRQRGKWRGKVTKAHAAHHATKAQPFFGPAARAYLKQIRAGIRSAAKQAVSNIAKRN